MMTLPRYCDQAGPLASREGDCAALWCLCAQCRARDNVRKKTEMSIRTEVTRRHVACLYHSPTTVMVRPAERMMRAVRQQDTEMFITLSQGGVEEDAVCLTSCGTHRAPTHGTAGRRSSLYSCRLTSRHVLHSPDLVEASTALL